MMTTPPEVPPETQIQTPQPLFLSDSPARITAYLEKSSTDKERCNFSTFLGSMEMTNFDDVFEIRSIFESQAHTLGAVFQYLMIEGDWKDLRFALRAQKMMMDTIDTMNGYPSTSYRKSLPAKIEQETD